MADRVSASIKVGRVVAATQLAEFTNLIDCEGLGPDWDGGFESEAELRAYLSDGDAGVTFYAHEVRDGEFEDLQAFCMSQGLTYDGYAAEWGPGRRIRRPQDPGAGVSCPLDADQGYACIGAEQIATLGLRSLKDILAHLERFDLSETPPFVISGEADAGAQGAAS